MKPRETYRQKQQSMQETDLRVHSNVLHLEQRPWVAIFFGCQLLGYVSRAVRPSVSYNNAKRTIPIREKQQKHSRSLAKTMKRINRTKFENKLILRGRVRQRRKCRSGVKSSMVHKKKGGSAQRSHWVRDTGDKRRIRSKRRKHR